MPNYISNKNHDDKGRHEVHTLTCLHLPLLANQLDLGYFPNCESAIAAVQSQNLTLEFDGCAYCCPTCHKG